MKMFKCSWWISLAVLFAISVHSQLKFSPFDSGWCHHYHSNKRTCKTDWRSLKNIYKGSHPAKVRLRLLEIYCAVDKFNPSGTHLTTTLSAYLAMDTNILAMFWKPIWPSCENNQFGGLKEDNFLMLLLYTLIQHPYGLHKQYALQW